MCLPIFAGIGFAMGVGSAATATTAAVGATAAAAVGTTVAATTIGAAALSAYSSYASGQSQKQAGEYNAKVQRDAAEAATQRGAIMAGDEQDKARRVAGIQRTQMASGGLNLSTGSPLDILTETAGTGQLNALRTISNAQREAYGLNANAELDLFKGNAAARTGTLNAAGGMLSAAGGAYASFAKFK